MKANKLAALIVTTYIGFISTAHASAPQPVFSPEQEARIGDIAGVSPGDSRDGQSKAAGTAGGT